MTTTKLATAAAVSLALASASGVATAAITGVPAEAQLGPMVLHDPDAPGGLETYIGLYVPAALGVDTVVQLSAPHVLAGGPTAQTEAAEIHWVLFDENSEKVENGICEVSPGDYVLWTTDAAVQSVQTQQTTATDYLPAGTPSSFCGPSNPKRFGYVVFETDAGANGNDADFAFWAAGAIVDNESVLQGYPSIGTIPMLGMADGFDSGDPAEQPTLVNSVIVDAPFNLGPQDPIAVAPILAGVRMNDSDANQEYVYLQAPIQGVLAGYGVSYHMFWFDRNNPNRSAQTIVWDDQEGDCSDSVKLPRELNIWAYNVYSQVAPGFGIPPSWTYLGNTAFNDPDRHLTDVIAAVQPNPATGYSSETYCRPDYWDAVANANVSYPGALGGYVQYKIAEINDPQPAPGVVNSAAAAWNWQEATSIPGGWATHMTADLGKF